jgi:hypothetical protein
MLSATAMSSCPRNLKLTRTRDYYSEPPRLYYAVRGALIHGFLEGDIPDVTTEKRIYKYVTTGANAPWLMSGRVDYYDHKSQTIEDYKTMSDKGTYMLFKEGIKAEHIWQLNIYRWLMHGGHLGAPDGPQIFWPVKRLQIHSLFMNRVISTGTPFLETLTQRAEPNGGKKWRMEVKGTRKEVPHRNQWVKKWQFQIYIPDPPIVPYAQVEAHLAKRGPERLQGFLEPSYMPPGIRQDDDKNWQCDFCDVRAECDEIEKATAVINAIKSATV